jgi:citrate synthase
MATLTAHETATRLGVKLGTVYAYVSRGLLESHTTADRTSRFDSRQVEQLAVRGRPRLSSQESSINLLIETGLTMLTESGVVYRGHHLADLVAAHSFEEVAELLWTGVLSDGKQAAWESQPIGPFHVPIDQQVRVICSLVPPTPLRWSAPDPASVAAEARTLLATIVDSLIPVGPAVRTRLVVGDRRLSATIAARLWPRLTRTRATPEGLRLLNTALIVMADHELATSTLAVRVAASTLASPSAAVLAGLGAMQGPLHGGASRLARELLLDAHRRGAAAAVQSRLANNEKIAGFGHRVYVGPDPRATLMLDLMQRSFPRHRALQVANDVINEVVQRIGKQPNVDIALAAFELAMDMEPNSAETIFTVARVAGWIAHAIEEYSQPPLRFRARAHYTGPVVKPRVSPRRR